MSGQFTLFVATDATNTVYEYTFENNNVTAAPNPVLVRPLPFADLIVSNVATPAAGSSGQALTIDWTITNQGTGTTNTASWYDRMVLSRDDQLGNGDDVFLFNTLRSGGLLSGGNYAATTDVVLPNGIEGDFYLFVIADATDVVDEFILEGNNTRRSDLISITLTLPPDLQVTSITVPVAALTAGVVDVSWQITNRGVGSADGNWLDRIYLSNDATVGGDQLLGSLAHTGGLASGNSYTGSITAQLPELADGAYYIVVVTDAAAEVFEHQNENNNASFSTDPFSVVHPDLRVTSLSVPTQSSSGNTMLVQWTIGNTGTGRNERHAMDGRNLRLIQCDLGRDGHLIGPVRAQR